MQTIDESRVLKKYVCTCGRCGGTGVFHTDERTFTCENCGGSGLAFRSNKLKELKMLLEKKSSNVSYMNKSK